MSSIICLPLLPVLSYPVIRTPMLSVLFIRTTLLPGSLIRPTLLSRPPYSHNTIVRTLLFAQPRLALVPVSCATFLSDNCGTFLVTHLLRSLLSLRDTPPYRKKKEKLYDFVTVLVRRECPVLDVVC